MNGRRVRETRKVAQEAAQRTAESVVPVLSAAADHAFGLQKRIEALEQVQTRHVTFMGRVRWFLGR